MISEAAVIAKVAALVNNKTVADTFTRRAAALKSWFLANMWSEESKFVGVYKEGVELSGSGGCTTLTLQNQTDSTPALPVGPIALGPIATPNEHTFPVSWGGFNSRCVPECTHRKTVPNAFQPDG